MSDGERKKNVLLDIAAQGRALDKILVEKSREVKSLRRNLAEPITGPDDLDNARKAAEKSVILFRLRREHQELASAQIAKKKFDGGAEVYRTCSGACGEKISDKRLAAVPWAIYCTQCQELQDQFERDEFSPVSLVEPDDT